MPVSLVSMIRILETIARYCRTALRLLDCLRFPSPQSSLCRIRHTICHSALLCPPRTMVPRQRELQRGTHVNIVLKADQRSGKLTSGQVQDILTRGDHPRGVKARLSNGQVGRVQSLRVNPASVPHTNIGTSSSSLPASNSGSARHTAIGTLQEPQPPDTWPNPVHSTSLMDYVKPNNSRPSSNQDVSMSLQDQLEKTFPGLDPSLIAAILADYPTLEAAEGVLYTLCTT